jgi:hypothetical protein
MLRTPFLLIALAGIAAAQSSPAPPAVYDKDTEATQARPAADGQAILWMNPLKWTWVKSDREDTSIYFHNSGRAQARLIATADGQSAEEQLVETLERIRKLDQKAHVGFEEKRIVNGQPMLCAQIIVGDSPDKEVVYYGYLFGDETRSIQLFAIASRADMTELYVELTSLLNGLEIAQRTP